MVFRSTASDAESLGEVIAECVERHHCFRPRVLVLSRDELRAAMEANPFPQAESEPKTLHLSFLAETASAPRIDAIEEALAATERYLLTQRVFYLHAPDGIGRSKLAGNVERLLGVEATARNWRTVTKLADLAGE